MPLLPVIGLRVNGARLWVHFGSLRFQPGELGKIALIVFLAAYLREKREVLAAGRLKDWGPLLVIWGAAMMILFVTDDLGSGLLFYGIFLGMLYVATARVAFVAVGARALPRRLGRRVPGHAARARARRELAPPVDDARRSSARSSGQPAFRQDCQSYQEVQSLYSIAHGAMGGTGLGTGTFTTASGHQIIPYLNTDFIYSALAQELGLIGAAGLLLLYMVFVLRGFRIALFAGDGFSKLLAAGLTFGFALQTFIIVGGILRVIPLTGITLPLVSYGGSSIVANFLVLAGLMLVSNRANARARRARGEPAAEPARARRGRAARRARRRDDVLADVGVGRAAGPAGQRDPARRAVHDRARPDRGRRREDGVRDEPQEEAERRDALLPPLSRSTGSPRRRSATRRSRARRPASSAR